jgi:hypothetical protein
VGGGIVQVFDDVVGYREVETPVGKGQGGAGPQVSVAVAQHALVARIDADHLAARAEQPGDFSAAGADVQLVSAGNVGTACLFQHGADLARLGRPPLVDNEARARRLHVSARRRRAIASAMRSCEVV